MAMSKISESCVFICLLGLTSVTYVTLGDSECKSPLGMEDGRIKDSQITVTSFTSTVYGGQTRLRQNIPAWGAWCVDASGGSMTKRNYHQYIQIDLLSLTNITGIATQGREYNGRRETVENYTISYRKDGGVWHFYRGKDQAVKVFPGNKNVSTVVRHDLDPAILAGYIRVHPGYGAGNKTCMRLVEIYGCAVKVILSYSMPVGQTTWNGKVHYEDTSYNGVITNDFYKYGTGILTDGKRGRVTAKVLKGWVGWSSLLTQSQYIDITFEFSGVRKFTDVTLFVHVNKKRGNAVFNRSRIFFSSTKDGFSDTSFLQCYPRNFPTLDKPHYAHVTLSLCKNTARFMKLRLYFGGKWLLITEISFNSVAASGNEKKSLQDCLNSGDTCSVTPSSPTGSQKPSTVSPKSGCIETTNSIVMFFVGIAVTLAIVLIVLFVILIIYKRRRQASKSVSTAVDTVGIENQAAETETESSPNNNQGLDHVSPANGRTAPHEEVQIISPPSVYEMLNRNRPVGRETTNSDRSSRYVMPDTTNSARSSGYVMPDMTNSDRSSGNVMPDMTNSARSSGYVMPDMTNSDRSSGYVMPDMTNSARSSGYVIPDNGRIASSVNDEPIRNGPDGKRASAYSDCSSGYEEVQISSLPGYTELDNTKREQKDDAHYQKLIKK